MSQCQALDDRKRSAAAHELVFFLGQTWRRRSKEKLRMNQFLASSFEFKETITQRSPWLALENLLLQPGRHFPGIGATS
jgi:hypothetical protein